MSKNCSEESARAQDQDGPQSAQHAVGRSRQGRANVAGKHDREHGGALGRAGSAYHPAGGFQGQVDGEEASAGGQTHLPQ